MKTVATFAAAFLIFLSLSSATAADRSIDFRISVSFAEGCSGTGVSSMTGDDVRLVQAARWSSDAPLIWQGTVPTSRALIHRFTLLDTAGTVLYRTTLANIQNDLQATVTLDCLTTPYRELPDTATEARDGQDDRQMSGGIAAAWITVTAVVLLLRALMGRLSARS